MNLKILFTTTAFCLIQGCTSLITPSPAPVSANLMVQCTELEYLKEKATLGDLLQYTIDLIEEYKICAARHAAMVRWEEEQMIVPAAR